jgi:ubiquinone/menaquinone biosynthesis C-methylase UbiE
MTLDKSKYIKTVDGIPFLSNISEDKYWGKATKEELEKAIRVIERKGWDEFKKIYSGKFDFTFEENRADWRFPIPVDKNYEILDIGAGMGRISIPLSRIAKKVVAVDQSFLRLKFLKKRAKSEELDNIEIYVGDIFDLPFKHESFDLIVMNGLLEWVGATDKYKDPREAQLVALEISRNLLKPGGYIYIGIENRFAFSYLVGRDHSGLRYTSYMPRKMADLYTKLRKRKRYDTYTYSKKGYENLLREAGFKDQDYYLVYPGYNNPRITVPYFNLNILSYAIRDLMAERSWKHRVAKTLASSRTLLWFYRKLFFSFNIIARK